jgi:anti-sigma regulatory factor (Ser/Thr protein kinase)
MTPGTPVELFLARHPSSVGQARKIVRAELDRLYDGEIVENAMILVSELVTNAILHGQGTVFLCVAQGRHRVRVEVGDDGPPLAGLRDGNGRQRFGIRFLERLADRWGVESTGDDGKKVWFELVDPTR